MISTVFAYVSPKKLAAFKLLVLCLLGVVLLTSGVCYANTGIAQLLTPQNGSQVSGYPAVQFSWTSVPDALQYVLWVGTTQDSYNILYFATQSTGTSSLIPPAQTYYVRIWTQ